MLFVGFLTVASFGGIGFYYMNTKGVLIEQANKSLRDGTDFRAEVFEERLEEEFEELIEVAEEAIVEEYLEGGLEEQQCESL